MPFRQRFQAWQTKHLHSRPLTESSKSSQTSLNDQKGTNDNKRAKSQEGRLAPDSVEHRSSQEHSATLESPFPEVAPHVNSSSGAAGEFLKSSQDDESVLIPADLWDRAYEQLKARNEDLVLQYEKILAENLRISHASQSLASMSVPPGLMPGVSRTGPKLSDENVMLARFGTHRRQIQMNALLNEKIKDNESSVLKIRIGTSEVTVREQVDKVVKVIAAAKDFVGASLASEPHAALAWTGVCTLLPLLLIPSEQRVANEAGLAEVAELIQYYHIVEIMYRNVSKDEIGTLIQAEFEAKIVDLYCLILEYQAQTIRQLSANILIRNYGKVKSTWEGLIISIRASHALCRERLNFLDGNRLQGALEAHESRINSRYTVLFQQLIDLQESGNETLRILRDQIELKRKEDLEVWLRRIDQRYIQAARQRKREPKTGQWLLEGQIFRDWFEGITPLVWLNGGVGCGKSILCSSLIEKLQNTTEHPCTLAYFYSSWDNPASHDLDVILSCILSQYASDSRFVSRLEILKKEGEKRVLDSADKFRVLLEVLSEVSARARSTNVDDGQEAMPIILIMDALDEIPFGAQRDSVIEFLSDIAAAQLCCFRVFVASRRDIDIEERLVTQKGYQMQEIDTYYVDGDVEIFVEGQMARHPRLKLQSDEVKQLISDGLVTIANGMFQLASLQMEELQKKNQQTLRAIDVEKTLKSLPRGLEESYKLILDRLQIQDQLFQECLIALKWLIYSKRPLSIDELVDACVLIPSAKITWDPQRRLNPVDLINNLVGLVTVRTDYLGKRIVSLAHLSVREYLVPSELRKAAQDDILGEFAADMAHRFIAKSCLILLAHCVVAEDGLSDHYALRDYAWHWWAGHAAASVYIEESRATQFALRLFNSIAFPTLYKVEDESGEIVERLREFTTILKPSQQMALEKVLADPRFPNSRKKSLFTNMGSFNEGKWEFSDGPYPMLRWLPHNLRSLRLLVLHPPKEGAPFDQLEGRLCMDSLDNRPVYTAISYTSQETFSSSTVYEFDETHSTLSSRYTGPTIRIYEDEFPIKPSLATALMQLRHMKHDRVIWVDALCVSMHDPDERTGLVQTQRMFDIYRSADDVAVWLGSENESSKDAMRLLKSPLGIPKDELDIKGKKRSSEAVVTTSNAVALDELFLRSIWWRSWAVQELVCGNRVMLYCGYDSVDWDQMRPIDEIYNENEIKCRPHHRDPQRSVQGPADFSPRSNAMSLQKLRQEYRSGKRPALIELLDFTQRHSCNRPEDKIFSLLSLLEAADIESFNAVIDGSHWSIGPSQEYSAAAQFIITKSQDLDILSYALGESLAIPQSSLPSWVPNWAKLRTPTLDIGLYNADSGHIIARDISFPALVSGSGRFLAFNGVIIDQITRVENEIYNWTHEGVLGTELDSVRDLPRDQSKIQMYWRTVLADSCIDEDGIARRIKNESLSIEELGDLVTAYLQRRVTTQKIVYTKNGYLGSTHSSAREEDLLILAPGGRIPLVVRKTEKFDDHSGYGRKSQPIPSYILESQSTSLDCVSCRYIGQSYVHGIMDGEYFDSMSDEAQRVPKRFLIV